MKITVNTEDGFECLGESILQVKVAMRCQRVSITCASNLNIKCMLWCICSKFDNPKSEKKHISDLTNQPVMHKTNASEYGKEALWLPVTSYPLLLQVIIPNSHCLNVVLSRVWDAESLTVLRKKKKQLPHGRRNYISKCQLCVVLRPRSSESGDRVLIIECTNCRICRLYIDSALRVFLRPSEAPHADATHLHICKHFSRKSVFYNLFSQKASLLGSKRVISLWRCSELFTLILSP